MKNYKLTICYDGSRYHGWERKKNVDTIEGKLTDVLSRMCGTEVKVIGAGRTDAGVHAKAMTANVHMDTAYSVEEISSYLNRYLPDDISVENVTEASERFHARYNATGKWYRYTCYIGKSKPVFERKYVTMMENGMNIEAMQEAARYLMGEHDFKSFCGNSKMKKSTIRNVDRITITQKGDFLYFDFHGNGFLQNMVRILTGTILEVGYGRRKPAQMIEILDALDRSKAGPTAPAQGLCLMKVDY